MKKLVLIGIAVTVFAVAALSIAGFAYAQTTTPRYPGNMGGAGMMQGGGMGSYAPGMMGRWDGEAYGPLHTQMVGAFAEALGLTPEELEAKLAAGETMYTIAQAQGLSDEEFTTLMVEARSKALAQAVTDGAITQEQAEWMNQRMQQMQGYGNGIGGCPMQNGGRGRGGRWNNQ
jgi:hypothetical protein